MFEATTVLACFEKLKSRLILVGRSRITFIHFFSVNREEFLLSAGYSKAAVTSGL